MYGFVRVRLQWPHHSSWWIYTFRTTRPKSVPCLMPDAAASYVSPRSDHDRDHVTSPTWPGLLPAIIKSARDLCPRCFTLPVSPGLCQGTRTPTDWSPFHGVMGPNTRHRRDRKCTARARFSMVTNRWRPVAPALEHCGGPCGTIKADVWHTEWGNAWDCSSSSGPDQSPCMRSHGMAWATLRTACQHGQVLLEPDAQRKIGSGSQRPLSLSECPCRPVSNRIDVEVDRLYGDRA